MSRPLRWAPTCTVLCVTSPAGPSTRYGHHGGCQHQLGGGRAGLWEFMRSVIGEAVANHQRRDGDRELLDLLQDATDPDTGRKFTPQAVIDELTVFLIAGHDTAWTIRRGIT